MLTKHQTSRFSYISRILFIPLAACLVLAFSVRTQPNVTLQYIGETVSPEATTSSPLWHILRPVENAQSDTVPAATKKPKEVSMKNDRIEVEYEDGTKTALTLTEAIAQCLDIRATRKDSSVVLNGGSTSVRGGFEGLVLVDGKEYEDGLEKLDPRTIESVNILKGYPAIKKYGSKGEKGAIEITLKKVTTLVSAGDTIKPRTSSNPTFTQVETTPRFRGGETEWRRYLEKNLNAAVPVDSGAPAGTYTVLVQMLVEPDGTLSEIKPLTKHGYGMEQEVLRVLKLGPKWEPAQQNGRAVRAYKKQPITFVIVADDKKEVEPPVVLKSGATLSVAQLQALPFGKLIKPEASITLPNTNTKLSSTDYSIYSGALTIDGDHGTVHEAPFASDQPTNRIQSLIAGAVSGRLITIDRRVGITKDGKQFKLPSLVYFIK